MFDFINFVVFPWGEQKYYEIIVNSVIIFVLIAIITAVIKLKINKPSITKEFMISSYIIVPSLVIMFMILLYWYVSIPIMMAFYSIMFITAGKFTEKNIIYKHLTISIILVNITCIIVIIILHKLGLNYLFYPI